MTGNEKETEETRVNQTGTEKKEGCLLCGKPIRYEAKAERKVCAVCGKEFLDNASCEDGHYICSRCHSLGMLPVISVLLSSEEKDPIRLFLAAVAMDGIHMHGPEHHTLVPCVLLTAYHNCGGRIGSEKEPLSLSDALTEAVRRGSQVPGGFCGFWGVCGAAVGAGIYGSIVSGSGPLNGEAWPVPQRLTAACLNRLAEVGGPRCCKRTGRLAIETAVSFTKEQFGITMPVSRIPCEYFEKNAECLRGGCLFFSGK